MLFCLCSMWRRRNDTFVFSGGGVKEYTNIMVSLGKKMCYLKIFCLSRTDGQASSAGAGIVRHLMPFWTFRRNHHHPTPPHLHARGYACRTIAKENIALVRLNTAADIKHIAPFSAGDWYHRYDNHYATRTSIYKAFANMGGCDTFTHRIYATHCLYGTLCRVSRGTTPVRLTAVVFSHNYSPFILRCNSDTHYRILSRLAATRRDRNARVARTYAYANAGGTILLMVAG